ncbi:hypothetical protein PED39_03545 [Methanomassiliicoccales archaeon LGM-RCC1]|nr:hypothetical protein PED39_03545 [Methanomassiliicoccales archaeon LGM-RCC1]
MSDCKICPICKEKGEVGVMEMVETLDLGLNGTASNTEYSCDRCGTKIYP